MAISCKTLKYIKNMIKKAGFRDFKNLNMCELGSQKMMCFSEYKSAKEYFEFIGVNHTSIDLNGKFGSLILNLCKEIDLKGFDVVTNLGTSEHVKNHSMCFKNINNFCNIGGIIINVLPAEGSWIKHNCFRRYTKEFFKDLSEKNSYDILDLNEEKSGNGKDHIYCTLRRII